MASTKRVTGRQDPLGRKRVAVSFLMIKLLTRIEGYVIFRFK